MKQFTISNPINLNGNDVAISVVGIEAAKDDTLKEIQLVNPKGEELCYADVQDKWGGQLGYVPALLLEMSQDPLQRSFSGLHTYLMLTSKVPVPADTEITILIIKPKQSTILRPSAAAIQQASK